MKILYLALLDTLNKPHHKDVAYGLYNFARLVTLPVFLFLLFLDLIQMQSSINLL